LNIELDREVRGRDRARVGVLGLARVVSRDGLNFTVDVQPCQLTLPRVYAPLVGAQVPTIDPAIVQAQPPIRVGVRVTQGAQGLVMNSDVGVLQLGVNLRDPISGALPTGATDPQVVDTDRNGQPGVDLRVRVLGSDVRVYVATRGIFQLSSPVADPQDFGTSQTRTSPDQELDLVFDYDYQIYGSTGPIDVAEAARQSDAYDRENFVRETLSFRATAVDQAATCASLGR
jgi:hypothetical protein